MLSSIDQSVDSITLSSTPSTHSLSLCDHSLPLLSLSKLPKKKSKRLNHSFHSQFNSLKSKLNLEDTRKTHIDSLLKKVKSKCLKAVHEVLKNSVNLIVGRLPQVFITNIKIDYNKYYLNRTIGDINHEFNILPAFSEIEDKKIIRKGKYELLRELYFLKLKDVYTVYLESDLFKKDFEKIKEKDGERIVSLYDFVASNMCEYFLMSKGNKKNINIEKTPQNPKKTVFNIQSK